jgi:hypothetical protein
MPELTCALLTYNLRMVKENAKIREQMAKTGAGLTEEEQQEYDNCWGKLFNPFLMPR